MRRAAIIAIAGTLIAAGAVVAWRIMAAHTSGPLIQQAYVAQKEWSPALKTAVTEHAGSFDELLVYAGKIDGLECRLVDVDFSAFSGQSRIGMVLDAGVSDSPKPEAVLAALKNWRSHQINPVEILLDDDVLPQETGAYADAIGKIHDALAAPGGAAKLSVIINKARLDNPSFAALASAAGSFVVQEYNDDPIDSGIASSKPLFDPVEARADVELAAKAGIPFRVELPDFTQEIAIDKIGQPLAWWSAERQPEFSGLDHIISRRPADRDLADLVTAWTARRPAGMTGIIWNRLPSETDLFSWRWVTLAAIMSGTVPQPDVRVTMRVLDKNLTEIDLENHGNADAVMDRDVNVTWREADLVDSNALPGFEQEVIGRYSLRFHPTASLAQERLRPDEKRGIGWAKLTDDFPITAEFAGEVGH